MKDFKFELEAPVRLIDSQNEHGKVTGRAEYTTSEDHYLVRYKRTTGELTECWWPESAIEAAV